VSSTPEFESRRGALVAEIEAAFDGVAREGGTTLHEAGAMDDWKSAEEQRAARRLDGEARWQDVPDEDISARDSALSFLNAKGFRYYVPAFMLYALRHWAEDSDSVLSSCKYHLLHLPSTSLRQSEPSRIAARYQFTAAQSRAVASFLRFALDFDEARADAATSAAVEKWERFGGAS
jgi:hypothetical protein